MSKLNDIRQADVFGLLNAFSLAKAGLAINAAAAPTIKTLNALSVAINGVFVANAALAAQSIAITHDSYGAVSLGYVQPAGQTVYYTLGINALGVISVAQGTFAGQKYNQDPTVGVGSANMMGTTFIGSGNVSDVPAGYAPFGVIKVVTTGVATFTPGTTALDAANVTVSYFDVAVVPGTKL